MLKNKLPAFFNKKFLRKNKNMKKELIVLLMGSRKDRNGRDLTEAQDKKRWQEYTEELYKKDLHDHQIITMV